MPKEKYEVGDTVMLKSGGPIMTIDEITSTGQYAYCAWFEGATRHYQKFNLDSLNKATPEDKQ